MPTLLSTGLPVHQEAEMFYAQERVLLAALPEESKIKDSLMVQKEIAVQTPLPISQEFALNC